LTESQVGGRSSAGVGMAYQKNASNLPGSAHSRNDSLRNLLNYRHMESFKVGFAKREAL
jgi:hypothetical protein